MSNHLQYPTRLATRKGQVVGRRDFLRQISAASVAAGSLNVTDMLSVSAEQLRARGMSCILLWMQGGPSQFETFSPKPDHKNGGETKSISTSVPGIHIAENFPYCAKVMDDLAIIRSMTSKEGNHQRATYLLHHGYLPMAGVKFPTLGANIAHQIGDAAHDLPSHVRIGGRLPNSGGGGFLGIEYDPLVLGSAHTPRLLSASMEAFDIQKEPGSQRAAYGGGDFAAGCRMARRLVEHGVTFVEVTSRGWDTHQDVFSRTQELSRQVDQPMAALITDLKRRGMLEKTLVVWMGEFGRTPRVNPRGGRDHYPQAFNAVVAGGGTQGGQVIGATNDAGTEVARRPVSVQDLFRTIYHTLEIDAEHEKISRISRPIKLVDGGEVVEELFG
jgi:hypothetical protein